VSTEQTALLQTALWASMFALAQMRDRSAGLRSLVSAGLPLHKGYRVDLLPV